MDEAHTSDSELNIDQLLLIVVGAHLRAERFDRPLAYRLRERILRWQDAQRQQRKANGAAALIEPLVCTDLWYLNARELHSRPTIAIGDPSSNAAVAYFSTRLPTAFVIENTLRVHLDPEFIDCQACLWGATTGATASAIDVFIERYLDAFLEEVI